MSEQQLPASSSIRHDWYQTDAAVVVTVLAKNAQKNFTNLQFNANNITVQINYPDNPYNLKLNLSHEVVPEHCSYKITPSKVEVKLKKAEGIRWNQLEGKCTEVEQKVIPQSQQQSSGPPSYPTSKPGRDWNAIEKNIKQEEANEKPEGEEALNKLFQEIYGKGSDEVKKAMNKSYLESGGTVLSTNWDEIRKDKVDVKPPDGMEWKKWES